MACCGAALLIYRTGRERKTSLLFHLRQMLDIYSSLVVYPHLLWIQELPHAALHPLDRRTFSVRGPHTHLQLSALLVWYHHTLSSIPAELYKIPKSRELQDIINLILNKYLLKVCPKPVYLCGEQSCVYCVSHCCV